MDTLKERDEKEVKARNTQRNRRSLVREFI
jgi:hypothetical protein